MLYSVNSKFGSKHYIIYRFNIQTKKATDFTNSVAYSKKFKYQILD